MKHMKGQAKHLKRRKIKLTERFWALMVILLGILSMFIFVKMGESDVTGQVFMIFIGTLAYIDTFGEDK